MRVLARTTQQGALFILVWFLSTAAMGGASAPGFEESPLNAIDTGELRMEIGDGRDSLATFSYSSPTYADAPLSSGVRSGLSYSYTQRAGGSFLHLSLSDGATGTHRLAGATFGELDVSFLHGDGEGLNPAQQGFSGIASNFFHGTASRPYQYSGGAVAYPWTEKLSSHAGAVSIQAPGADSRSVQFSGFSLGNFSATYYQVERDKPVGHGISLVWDARPISLRYDELDSDYDATWREVSAAYRSKDRGTFRLSLSSGRNDLYKGAGESRIGLSYQFCFGGPRGSGKAGHPRAGRNFAAHRAAINFQDLTRLGLGAVSRGLVMTSGDPVLDQAPRYYTQWDAAYSVLAVINPVSVSENVEYGGSIYRSPDGTYSPSQVIVQGTAHQVGFNPHALVPDRTVATAAWHTHAATDPLYVNEFFSPADLQFFTYYRVDGYLGTPMGRMFGYELATGNLYRYIDPYGNDVILPH